MSEELPLGEDLRSRYRVLSRIGRGAFSQVYLARDVVGDNEYVAVKQISTVGMSLRDAETTGNMFLQEARLLSTLNHAGLPRVLDYFVEGRSYFLIMEWIAGQTLLAIMQELDIAIPVEEVVEWGIDVCHILEYLHALRPHPVIVGDVKPSNIMRTFDGRMKLVDFGIAAQASTMRAKKRITFVSPGFSPPEQYGKQEIDERSDIYALGATLYYLATQEGLARFKFAVPPVSRFAVSAPSQFERILAKCLEPKRNSRYGSIFAIRMDLESVRDSCRARGAAGMAAREMLANFYRSKKPGLSL